MREDRSRSVAVPVTAAAAALAFLAALATAVLVAHASRANANTQSGAGTGAVAEQALAAARQIAVDFAAYDYRHINQDFNRVATESTGTFHQQYLTQSAGVRDLIVKAKAVSTATVTGAGVVESGPARVTVVLALNRIVKNTSVPAGQQDSFGLQLVLVHQGGRWLASQVTPL
jgi:Mce-associated membrane protein